MRRVMSKEEFPAIRDRQRESGLSIKDFCKNESYSAASFYYWQSKFGLSRSCIASSSSSDQLAPIRFSTDRASGISPVANPSVASCISLELPNGVKVHFAGSSACDSALHFITQLLSSHVLPE